MRGWPAAVAASFWSKRYQRNSSRPATHHKSSNSSNSKRLCLLAWIKGAARKPKKILSERDKMALKKNKLFKRIEADIKERGKRRSPGKSYIIEKNVGTSLRY